MAESGTVYFISTITMKNNSCVICLTSKMLVYLNYKVRIFNLEISDAPNL